MPSASYLDPREGFVWALMWVGWIAYVMLLSPGCSPCLLDRTVLFTEEEREFLVKCVKQQPRMCACENALHRQRENN
jgi:hypothetical protein